MFKPSVTLTLILILALLFLAACSPSNMRANGTGGIGLTTAIRMEHSVYSGPREDVDFANQTCVTGGQRLTRSAGDHPNYFERLTRAQKDRCVQIITSLCEEFDEDSEQIEPVPEWRPVGPPVGYLKYLTQKNRGQRDPEKIVRNHFACSLYAAMLESNARIQRDRRDVIQIYNFRGSQGSHNLSARVLREQQFAGYEARLEELSETYRARSEDRPALHLGLGSPEQKRRWREMFERADVIPLPVILMIAANESNYGRSEFGEDGWNLFGRHAFSRSCINEGTCVTTRRGSVALEKYYDLQHGIDDQFNYLNGAGVSEDLRHLRMAARRNGRELVSRELACGFNSYSATNGEYCRPYTDRRGRRQPSKYTAFIEANGKWSKYDRILGSRDVITVPTELLR